MVILPEIAIFAMKSSFVIGEVNIRKIIFLETVVLIICCGRTGYNFITQYFNMETYSLLKGVVSLLFVLGLIGVTGFLLKKLGEKSFGLKLPANKNIVVEEVVAIDHSRRVVVVKYLSKKYVLLLGNHDAVIDVINLKNK